MKRLKVFNRKLPALFTFLFFFFTVADGEFHTVSAENLNLHGKYSLNFDVKPQLTMEKYNKIKRKMTYMQVVGIIGTRGTRTMSSGKGITKLESYKWESVDFQLISVVFSGGKVISKVQANLK